MDLIEAVWEERNLGVSTLEAIFDVNDDVQENLQIIHSRSEKYLVLKIPTQLATATLSVQEDGFRFIEVITSCTHDAILPKLTPLQTRLSKSIERGPITSTNRNLLETAISKSLFKTDRVYLDPEFTSEQAATRYLGWVRDELDLGGEIMQITTKGRLLGFFVLRSLGGSKFVCNLAGLMPEYQSSGLGYFLNYFQILEVGLKHGIELKSTFSSNNRGASAVHLAIGYTLKEQFNVFVKHR